MAQFLPSWYAAKFTWFCNVPVATSWWYRGEAKTVTSKLNIPLVMGCI